MIVAGIMSGTSADGIDVALTRIQGTGDGYPKLKLLAHEAFRFPAALQKAILAAMNAQSTSTAELARLNWRLGLAYSEAVQKTLTKFPVKLDLIGCHGQTLYHQATAQPYAGKSFACTWQAGEASVLAGDLSVPVVSNFRPADMVAGGQGAPLVPLLDYVFFRHARRGRVLQNIGGIANFSAIPPTGAPDQVLALDSGPGNMLIDALMLELYGKPYDAGGRIAASGSILEEVLQQSLKGKYFKKTVPKTAGREEFGREYASAFLAKCRMLSNRKQDAVATATALTSTSIADAFIRFAASHMQGAAVDYIVSGGGVRNRTLMAQLTERLKLHRCKVTTTDQFGLPAESKEAAAFALLAWQTWHGKPGNLPSATGAKRPALLGQITYA